MEWNHIIAAIFLILGAFFSLTGGVGILRMPDFYARIHPAGKNDTLGQFLLLFGLLFAVAWPEDWIVGSKLILMTIFVFITAPTATHAITKAAWMDNVRPMIDEDTSDQPLAPLPGQSPADAPDKEASNG